MYHRTLCFMLHVAARTLFPDRVLHIYHGYGLEGMSLAAPGQGAMRCVQRARLHCSGLAHVQACHSRPARQT